MQLHQKHIPYIQTTVLALIEDYHLKFPSFVSHELLFLCYSGSPKSPIVHSHTVSEASQPESDMPLPEIVTGSILQGLHDEISMKLAEDLAMNTREHPSEDITYTEFQTRDFPMNDCQQRSSTKSPRTEGTMHFGVRWVRVTPDKNLVSNIYSCVAKAAELVVNNWQWVPVALPIVLIAINC